MGWVHLLRLLSYSEVSDLDLQDHTQIVIEVQAMRTLCRNKYPVNLIEELSPHIQSDYVPGKKNFPKENLLFPTKEDMEPKEKTVGLLTAHIPLLGKPH